MNILLTGSSGFFGKEILRNNTIYSVFTLNRKIGDYKYDLSKSIPDFDKYFDIVIHNAGKAHYMAKSNIEKESFLQVNVKGTNNLLKGLENKIPSQFVFISSVAVYGLDSGQDISEGSPLLAHDPYGMSKIIAEKLVTDWCFQNNVICTILRLPLLVAKSPPGNLGDMHKAIKRGYYFNIASGSARKSMVLAEDVARFIPRIAKVGGIYNLTDGKHPSFKCLSNVLSKNKVISLPLFIAKALARIGDLIGNWAPINSYKLKKIICDLTFDDSRARKMGWKPNSVIEYLKKNEL